MPAVASRLRPVGHDDELTLVDHLDELRTRLVFSILTFIVFFGVCFWQNDRVLDVVNRPFERATQDQPRTGPIAKTATFQANIGTVARDSAALAKALQASTVADSSTKAAAKQLQASAERLRRSIPPPSAARQPVTLGVAEPFTATFRVAAYAALLLSLPILLWQAYAFVLPAFSPTERRVALPLLLMVPLLFISGASFAYFVVLPNAIQVLQSFNGDQFDILIQARDLYKFTILTCMALGGLFQVPIVILGLVRMEIISVAQLRANRRYAVLVIAVVAMLLPGTDPITLFLSMAPLLVLYEASILIAAALDRRARKREALEPDSDDED